ncbi:hypothetical protein ACH5RR_035433 [Cinchona calisaya]|uniref:Uncharacterized protein n=1 Tax=Cinchona calisaya TaxID=153742 RepID=A0ABD2Y064_9GENT
MDLIKEKGKKGLILKTWERCRSFGGIGRKSSSRSRRAAKLKSKSLPGFDATAEVDQKRAKGTRVAPEGYFSVYVGADKQRFVIKTDCLNHSLFKMLLEEAESEYGYTSEGPLELPCDVDIFIKVLAEMDCDEIHPRCSFSKTYSSYHLLSSPRLLALNKI